MADAQPDAGNRRADILAAARDLMAEQGVAGVTVRAVAARAGVGASTLRHYYPTQASLHTAMTQEIFTTLVTDEYIQDPARSARERLLASLWQFMWPADDSARLWGRALIRIYAGVISAEESGRQVSEGEVLGGAYASSHETVARWLSVLAAEGRLRPTDVAATAFALLAQLNGLMLDVAVGGIEPDRARAAIEAVVDLLVEE